MHRRTRTLSIDDQKAVDVCLDHAVLTAKSRITRMASPVPQRRLAAANKLLSLLSELPAGDPPSDLVARTLRRIEMDAARTMGNELPATAINGATVH